MVKKSTLENKNILPMESLLKQKKADCTAKMVEIAEKIKVLNTKIQNLKSISDALGDKENKLNCSTNVSNSIINNKRNNKNQNNYCGCKKRFNKI